MDLFDEICDLEVGLQKARVAAVRSSDAEMADRLAKMLKHDSTDTDVLGRAAGQQMLAGELKAAGVLEKLGQGRSQSEGPRRVGAQIGEYVVGERLGAGGLGAVHRAQHRNGAVVAIKFLKPHATADEDSVRRMRREFRAISKLDHPGCLRVFEHGASPLGHYIVMEHMAGGDLRKLIGAAKPTILRVLADVASALAYVHNRGVVHRDLKPANVLLTQDTPPQPKLADFGIAKMADASAIITDSRAVMGSIDYMSPEQLRGNSDARSDLYAFGCMIHELWCGEPPFSGDNFERLYARMNGVAPSLAERSPVAPPGLVAITDRLMKRDPDERPQMADELLAALQPLVHGTEGGG